jgi:cytoskeletal protein RodZ
MNNISGISVVTRKSHRKWKIIIMSLLIIVLLLIIAVGIISAVVGWKLIHPEREEIPKFSSNVVIEYKDVSLKISKILSILRAGISKQKTVIKQ